MAEAEAHRAICQAKHEAAAAQLAPLWAAVPQEVRAKVLSMDATSLLGAMRAGSLTSETVRLQTPLCLQTAV